MKSNFNMFNEFFDAQKNMFEVWQKTFNFTGQEVKDNKKGQSNYNPMNYYKDLMELNNKLFTCYTGNPYEVFNKIKQSNDIYEEFYKVWQKIKEDSVPTEASMKKAYEEWTSQCVEYMKKNYIPYIPEPMRKIFEESIAVMESYKIAINKFWEPWISSEQELNDTFFKGFLNDPSAYLDYLKLWKENYDKSFSKLINTPMMGIDREFLEKQFESFDKFVRYSVLVNEFSANIYKLTQETMEKILQDYMQMYKEGIEPKTFEEFYKYSTEKINTAFSKLFFSDEFSKLVGHILDAMTNFKIEADKLWEEYLSFMPVPKKTEMDSVYKTVYDMRKEMKNMMKEIDEVKVQINEQKNGTKIKDKSNTGSNTK
ncbi:poly(R)-hydroxyalkanoic acid synthase subunit PhaE [Clostridium homopropionicum]|nr:poly(R)-hydroxyalkanoic acid synthase subunit PhaE [Clostridium homopropionicum]